MRREAPAGRSLEPSSRLEPAAFILDLDGTLIRGREPVDGARDLLDLLDSRFIIVSNNSTHSAAGLAAELRHMDLPVEEDHLVLAGMTAVEVVARDYRGARVLVVGSSSLVSAANEAGIDIVDDRVDLVLLGRDEQFAYDKLARMANEITRGAMLVATNADGAHPGAGGTIVPETGALLRAVLSCATPRSLRVVGKPEPTLFMEALRRLRASPRDCIMVGDNPQTDGVGADRLGIKTLLVGQVRGAHIADLRQMIDRLASRRVS